MNKLMYSALFHKADEGGFWVSFPDFPECLTQERACGMPTKWHVMLSNLL